VSETSVIKEKSNKKQHVNYTCKKGTRSNTATYVRLIPGDYEGQYTSIPSLEKSQNGQNI